MNKTFQEFIDLINDEAVVKGVPVNGTFELTTRCSLHCRMCFLCNPTNPEPELSGEQWLDIMTQARDAGMLFAMITGGEPLLHKDFWDIYLGLRKLGVYITLNTNGTTITPEIADRLKENPPLRMQLSLYGSSPEAYEKSTGSAEAFSKAITGLDLLIDRGLEVRPRTILTKDTADDMVNLVPLILSYGAPFSCGNYVLPVIFENNNNPQKLRLSESELSKYTKVIEDAIKNYYEQHGDPRAELKEKIKKEYEAAAEKPVDPAREELKEHAKAIRGATQFNCCAGISRFSISYDGLIRLCEISRHPAFDLKAMSFAEGFEMLRKATAEIPLCAECSDCEYKNICSPCPPRHYIETGDFNKKAEYVCTYVKAGVKLAE